MSLEDIRADLVALMRRRLNALIDERWREVPQPSPPIDRGLDFRQALLVASLEAAVPLWIERLRSVPLDDLVERAHELGQVVAEKGDVIQFRGGKKGETARAFNALAEGLACLAFGIRGVTFLGVHFEAEHPERKSPTRG